MLASQFLTLLLFWACIKARIISFMKNTTFIKPKVKNYVKNIRLIKIMAMEGEGCNSVKAKVVSFPIVRRSTMYCVRTGKIGEFMLLTSFRF